MLFPNKHAVFKDYSALIHTAGTVQSYNCTGDCSKLVWVHSKNVCGFVGGKKMWPNNVLIKKCLQYLQCFHYFVQHLYVFIELALLSRLFVSH
jgi:hypothetical protein